MEESSSLYIPTLPNLVELKIKLLSYGFHPPFGWKYISVNLYSDIVLHYQIIRDHSYPRVQLAAWNVTEEKLHQIYFPVTYLKFLTTSIYP